MALSYLTPGLSRRIRKHLLAAQAPSAHVSRSLSRDPDKHITEENENDVHTELSDEKKSASLKSKIINRINRSISQDRGTSRFTKNKITTQSEIPEKSDQSYYRSVSNDSKPSENKISNTNDIVTLNSLYNSRMPVRNITSIGTNTPKYPSSSYTDVGSKVSRFLRSSFHEDLTRKNKEKETQEVLREIRKKRGNEEKAKKAEKVNEQKVEVNNDTKKETEVKTDEKTKSEPRKSRISRLLRPKSYPADPKEEETKEEYNFTKNDTQPLCNGVKSEDESSKEAPSPTKQITQPKTRINSLTKPKIEKNSKVESTIRSLRERSLPHNTDYCATESNLIKRAVSLEDFSVLSPPLSFKDKALQTSRKSVTKILGLFEKYENQSKSKQKVKKSTKKDDDKKEESNKNGTTKRTNPKKERTPKENEVNGASSKIPAPKKAELTPLEAIKLQQEQNRKECISEREKIPKLKLDLKQDYDYKKDNENLNFISPFEETTDSVCSDSQYNDISPGSTLRIFSDDEESESVSERIHRKSFYSRFNEKKKKKKSSSVGAYDFKEYLNKFDEPVSESSGRKIKAYDVRSNTTRNFNTYSSLRQPLNYSRQTSLPSGAEVLYPYTSPYSDTYRTPKKMSYIPGSSRAVSEGKDAVGKPSK